MPKRRRREASGGSGGVPAAAAALAPAAGGARPAGSDGAGGSGDSGAFSPLISRAVLDELALGPLPPARADEDPYVPYAGWQLRAQELFIRFLSRGGPDAVPLSRSEAVVLHGLLARQVQRAAAWHVRRGDAAALRRLPGDRSGPLGFHFARLSLLEQALPELAPDEPAVAHRFAEALRRRADLLEAAGPEAAAGDLRRIGLSEAAGSGAAAGGLREADETAGLPEAPGADFEERLRALSDGNLRRVADAAARRAESLRVSLMPFAVGGETPPDEARDLAARYRRAGELARAAAEEMRRRGVAPAPALSRALRLFGEWAPRFEAELERRLGASWRREGGETGAQAQETER